MSHFMPRFHQRFKMSQNTKSWSTRMPHFIKQEKNKKKQKRPIFYIRRFTSCRKYYGHIMITNVPQYFPYEQHTVINWYKASGFTGLFNTKDRCAITLVIELGSTSCPQGWSTGPKPVGQNDVFTIRPKYVPGQS